MPLRYLLDEHLRGGGLWQAIQQHNALGLYPLDAVRVGDPPDLPLGTRDPDILLWAEREGRILLSRDKGSLPQHLAQHLQAGHHSPGIFILRPGATIRELLAALALVAHAGNPIDYQDQMIYVPG
jgi:hypothetical protein